MLTTAVCCSPKESFNLLTAMALWAEMQIYHGGCARMFSSFPPALSPNGRTWPPPEPIDVLTCR